MRRVLPLLREMAQAQEQKDFKTVLERLDFIKKKR